MILFDKFAIIMTFLNQQLQSPNMGNQVCQTNNRQMGFSSNDPRQIIQIKNSRLSQKAKDYLETQKPYTQQLSQRNLIYKKLGKNFYHGEVNMIGKPNGLGKLYRADDSLYIGAFDNGLATGNGYLIFSNGDLYEGNFVKDNAEDPRAKLITENTHYVGGYKNNNFHGEGQIVSGSIRFKGQFKNGKMNDGYLKWKDSETSFDCQYTGKFDQNQKFTGQGELKTSKGIYTGQFLDGMKNGEGIFKYQKGYQYQGRYLQNQRSGQGTLLNSKGKIHYEGQWSNNMPNGAGKKLGKRRRLVSGTFIDGLDSNVLPQSTVQEDLFKTFQTGTDL